MYFHKYKSHQIINSPSNSTPKFFKNKPMIDLMLWQKSWTLMKSPSNPINSAANIPINWDQISEINSNSKSSVSINQYWAPMKNKTTLWTVFQAVMTTLLFNINHTLSLFWVVPTSLKLKTSLLMMKNYSHQWTREREQIMPMKPKQRLKQQKTKRKLKTQLLETISNPSFHVDQLLIKGRKNSYDVYKLYIHI